MRSSLLPISILLALSTPACTFIVDFDRGRVADDTGVVNDTGTPSDAGRDGGSDVGPVDAFAVDTNTDAFTPIDVGNDAFAESDTGVDAFMPGDTGVDAFVGTDAGVDAFAPDAFSASDAFAPPDAFTAPDAFTSPDAFTAPDAFTSPDAFVGPSFASTVSPIFQTHCTPCHAGGGSGGHNMGSATVSMAYSDSQLASYFSSGHTKGFAALVRIQNGSMPQGAGCTGNPATDVGNAACLTAAEQATIQAWLDGGQAP